MCIVWVGLCDQILNLKDKKIWRDAYMSFHIKHNLRVESLLTVVKSRRGERLGYVIWILCDPFSQIWLTKINWRRKLGHA